MQLLLIIRIIWYFIHIIITNNRISTNKYSSYKNSKNLNNIFFKKESNYNYRSKEWNLNQKILLKNAFKKFYDLYQEFLMIEFILFLLANKITK